MRKESLSSKTQKYQIREIVSSGSKCQSRNQMYVTSFWHFESLILREELKRINHRWIKSWSIIRPILPILCARVLCKVHAHSQSLSPHTETRARTRTHTHTHTQSRTLHCSPPIRHLRQSVCSRVCVSRQLSSWVRLVLFVSVAVNKNISAFVCVKKSY